MVAKIDNEVFVTILLVFPTLHLSVTNHNLNCNSTRDYFRKSRNRLWLFLRHSWNAWLKNRCCRRTGHSSWLSCHHHNWSGLWRCPYCRRIDRSSSLCSHHHSLNVSLRCLYCLRIGCSSSSLFRHHSWNELLHYLCYLHTA